jgi:hypothetical protein
MDLAEIIRRKLRATDTEYMIAKRSGVPQPTVNRFMNGSDIRLSNASALCRELGLELVEREGRARK